MATWSQFEAAEAEFAGRVRRLLGTRKHLTMATLRRDGSPRISGTEVEFMEGEIRIGSMPRTVKAADLLNDPRVAIHGPTHDPTKTGRWRGEAKLAGRALPVDSSGDGHLFRIDIDEAVITRLDAERKHLVIESWHPGRGRRVIERD